MPFRGWIGKTKKVWNAFNTLQSPCPDELRLFWGQRGGVQLNIRKVFLMFCTLCVLIATKDSSFNGQWHLNFGFKRKITILRNMLKSPSFPCLDTSGEVLGCGEGVWYGCDDLKWRALTSCSVSTMASICWRLDSSSSHLEHITHTDTVWSVQSQGQPCINPNTDHLSRHPCSLFTHNHPSSASNQLTMWNHQPGSQKVFPTHSAIFFVLCCPLNAWRTVIQCQGSQ